MYREDTACGERAEVPRIKGAAKLGGLSSL